MGHATSTTIAADVGWLRREALAYQGQTRDRIPQAAADRWQALRNEVTSELQRRLRWIHPEGSIVGMTLWAETRAPEARCLVEELLSIRNSMIYAGLPPGRRMAELEAAAVSARRFWFSDAGRARAAENVRQRRNR